METEIINQSTSSFKQDAEKLIQKIEEARKKACDCNIVNLTSNMVPIKLDIKCRKTGRGHLSKIYSIGYCPIGNIVSASQDGKLIVWQANHLHKIHAIPLKSSWVMTCSYSPSGNFVASGGLDNILSIYSLKNSDGNVHISKELVGHNGFISSIRFINDTMILSSSGDSTCSLWSFESGKIITSFEGHTQDVMCVDYCSVNDSIIASGSCDSTIRIWDIRSGTRPVQTCFTSETNSDVNFINFFPNGMAVGAASDGDHSYLFSIKSDQIVQKYFHENSGSSMSIDHSKSGRLIALGLEQNTSNIYDTFTGSKIQSLQSHESRVSGVKFTDYGLTTCCWDSIIRLYK